MLQANQLIGFGSGGLGAPDVTITFREAVPETATKTTYTFSSADIGTDSASHKVVVIAAWSGGATYSSSTINGTTGVQIVDSNANSGNQRCQMIYADNITASSGDVVVIVGGAGSDRLGIAIYDVRNAADGTAASTASDNDSSDPQTGTITIQAGGAGLGYMGGNNGGATWTNLDEDFDVTIEGAFQQSGASTDFTTLQSSLLITANPGSDGETSSVYAAFSKA